MQNSDMPKIHPKLMPLEYLFSRRKKVNFISFAKIKYACTISCSLHTEWKHLHKCTYEIIFEQNHMEKKMNCNLNLYGTIYILISNFTQ